MMTKKEIEAHFPVEVFGVFTPAESETLLRFMAAQEQLNEAVKAIQVQRDAIEFCESEIATARAEHTRLTAEGLIQEANTAAGAIPSIREKIADARSRIAKTGGQIQTLPITFDSDEYQRRVNEKEAEFDRLRKRFFTISSTAGDVRKQAAGILATIAETVN